MFIHLAKRKSMEFYLSILKANKESMTVYPSSKDDLLQVTTEKEILVISLIDLVALLKKDAESNGLTGVYNKEPVDKK